jgi:hypothetical protein
VLKVHHNFLKTMRASPDDHLAAKSQQDIAQQAAQLVLSLT